MWARFFLVGSRTDLRLKMGLPGVVLGYTKFGAKIRIFSGRNWTQKTPQFENFSEIGTFHKVIEHMWFDSERFWGVKRYSKPKKT